MLKLGRVTTASLAHLSYCTCALFHMYHACSVFPQSYTHNQLLTFIPKCFPHTYNTMSLWGSVTEKGEEMDGGDGEQETDAAYT